MSDAWTHEFSYPIPAPAPRLFRALTEEAELTRWFAEHARVEPRAGGPFRFWGRHTVGTPTEADAAGTLREFEAGKRIAFDWRILGVPSVVSISLTPEERDGASYTRVGVTHALEGEIEGPRPRELVDDWWRFTVGNLAAHATGHGEVVRPDFADPSPEIRLTTVIDASPARVFRALIEPAALDRWIAKEASVEPRVGGRFDLGWTSAEDVEHAGPPMRILELEPDSRLTISWPDWRGDASVPEQRVTWILEPAGSSTRVTLVHAGFVRAVDLSDYPFGWSHFLERMADVARSLDAA